MTDDETRATAAGRGADDPDAEQAEALSRAAREAVRQPADPRLEKSFAKLGLFADDEADAPAAAAEGAAGATLPRPAEPSHPASTDRAPIATPPAAAPPSSLATPTPAPVSAIASTSAGVDLNSVVAELVEVRATTDRLARQLTTLTALTAAALVGLVVVLILLLVR